MKKNSRRPDIDLLRAFAVLSVTLFHFDVPGLEGGFLGVDVFFVISGYLITSHLSKQIQDNTFSFKGFYLRRLARLLPALMFTLLITSVLAVLYLSKNLLEDFSISLISSAFYISNVYFYSQVGYFDTASHLKPLLHTWSLSVEEQFYLIWPIFILLLLKKGNVKVGIAIAGIFSLLAAELFYNSVTSLTFYMFPFRVFEFAIGAILFKLHTERKPLWFKYSLSVVGWCLIFYSIGFLDDTDKMPGLFSLPVCLGTAFIILGGGSYRLLPLRNLWLRVGLISYSAYLIHWPLVVFYKLEVAKELNTQSIILLLLLTLLFAEIMYRYVEDRSWLKQIKIQEKNAVVWPLSLIAFSLVFYLSAVPTMQFLNQTDVSKIVNGTLTHEQTTKKLAYLDDNFFQRKPSQRIVVIGDSHSKNLARSIGPYIDNQIVLKNGICDPVIFQDLNSVDLSAHYKNHTNPAMKNKDCLTFHKEFLDTLANLNPKYIIFSERWQVAALPYLKETINKINEKMDVSILLMGPNVELVSHPNVIFSKAQSIGELNSIAIKQLVDIDFIEKSILEIAKNTNVHFVSKINSVCPEGACRFHNNNMLYYTDTNHWSEDGMAFFGKQIVASTSFQRFIKSQAPIYDDNQIVTKQELSLNRFADLREFYRYTKDVNRFTRGNESMLVIGDDSALEVFSALWLKNYNNGNETSVLSSINACPPILGGETVQSNDFINQRKLDFDKCVDYYNKLEQLIQTQKPQKIIIAYNWIPELETSIKQTIDYLKQEIPGVDIVVSGMKPRVFAKGENVKVQKLHTINEALVLLSNKTKTKFINLVDLICKNENSTDCIEGVQKLYRQPNSLNLLGIEHLSHNLVGYE